MLNDSLKEIWIEEVVAYLRLRSISA